MDFRRRYGRQGSCIQTTGPYTQLYCNGCHRGFQYLIRQDRTVIFGLVSPRPYPCLFQDVSEYKFEHQLIFIFLLDRDGQIDHLSNLYLNI